jgi:hypothetical protein
VIPGHLGDAIAEDGDLDGHDEIEVGQSETGGEVVQPAFGGAGGGLVGLARGRCGDAEGDRSGKDVTRGLAEQGAGVVEGQPLLAAAGAIRPLVAAGEVAEVPVAGEPAAVIRAGHARWPGEIGVVTGIRDQHRQHPSMG